MKNSALWFSRLGFLRMARVLALVALLAAGMLASRVPLQARSRGIVGAGFHSFHGNRHFYPRYRFGFSSFYSRPFYRYSSYSFHPLYYPSVFYGPAYGYPAPLPVYQASYQVSYDDPSRRKASEDRTAWLRLDVQPPDALIYIDGQYAGKASEFFNGKKLLPVSPSDHILRIEAEGYQPAVVDLKVNPLQTLDVSQHLRATPSPSGVSSGGAPPVPSRESARSPERAEPIWRAPYSGRSRYRGSSESKTATDEKNPAPPSPMTIAEPTPRATPDAKAPPEKSEADYFGTLIVKFDKPIGEAAVYIDGKFIDVTESKNAEFVVNGMPAGKHVVVVTKPDYVDFRGDISVEANHSSTLTAALRKSVRK